MNKKLTSWSLTVVTVLAVCFIGASGFVWGFFIEQERG
jgi:nitrate reductase NapE component